MGIWGEYRCIRNPFFFLILTSYMYEVCVADFASWPRSHPRFERKATATKLASAAVAMYCICGYDRRDIARSVCCCHMNMYNRSRSSPAIHVEPSTASFKPEQSRQSREINHAIPAYDNQPTHSLTGVRHETYHA